MTPDVGALIVYALVCGWRLCKVYASDRKGNVDMIAEFLYSILMIYLLSSGSVLFLMLILLHLMVMTVLGLMARIFLPPRESEEFFDNNEMSFWLMIIGRLVFYVSLWLCVNY